MSVPARQSDQAAGHTVRLRADGRLRRAEDGTVTELARLLARDARQAAAAEAESGRRPGSARPAGARVRPGRTGRPLRLTPRPLAAGRA